MTTPQITVTSYSLEKKKLHKRFEYNDNSDNFIVSNNSNS